MKAHDVDWTTMRLGRRPDREVAEELGCHLDTVKAARRRLGFRACGAPRSTTAKADWSKVVFGLEPDAELAAKLGVETMTVTRRRRDLEVPAYKAPKGER